jgi:hypothetical protein
MRLSLLSSSDLSAEQRLLYKDMRIGIDTSFKGFTAIDETGTLIGPWNPWLRFPKFGGPIALNGFDVPVPEVDARK